MSNSSSTESREQRVADAFPGREQEALAVLSTLDDGPTPHSTNAAALVLMGHAFVGMMVGAAVGETYVSTLLGLDGYPYDDLVAFGCSLVPPLGILLFARWAYTKIVREHKQALGEHDCQLVDAVRSIAKSLLPA